MTWQQVYLIIANLWGIAALLVTSDAKMVACMIAAFMWMYLRWTIKSNSGQ